MSKRRATPPGRAAGGRAGLSSSSKRRHQDQAVAVGVVCPEDGAQKRRPLGRRSRSFCLVLVTVAATIGLLAATLQGVLEPLRSLADVASGVQMLPLSKIQMPDLRQRETQMAASAGGIAFLLWFLASLRRRLGAKAWKGADVKGLAICLAVGWLVRFLVPVPDTLPPQASMLLAIFAATICGVVVAPLPPAGVTTVAVAVAVITKAVPFEEAVMAFTEEVVWLVLLAFFFAEGFQKTGLGDRIALNIIKVAGGTPLSVAYGLNGAELILAACMPCSAARAAAVFYPITVSVARSSGSSEASGTRMHCGAFLVQCCYQATATSSCLFLSGAAQNYLVLKLAAGVGVEVEQPFVTWTLAALAPCIVCFVGTPLLVHMLLPPTQRSTPEAPRAAASTLQLMGAPQDQEKIFGGVILGMVVLWASASTTGLQPVVAAFLGISVLFLTGVLTWEECAQNSKAWSTYASFASLVSLAAALTRVGVTKWLASSVASRVASAGLYGIWAFLPIVAMYWVAHYLFASQVAHVSALYQPFLLLLLETGCPPLAAALSLAFVSNLFMTLTPYASAQSAVMLGDRYVSTGEWYKSGFVFMLFYATVWLSVGGIWWRLIGIC